MKDEDSTLKEIEWVMVTVVWAMAIVCWLPVIVKIANKLV